VRLYKISASEQAELLIENLETAQSFFSRAKGLLGRREMSLEQALWIKPCRDIHTFFMNFAIDCVFLDKEMKIKNIVPDVAPYKLVGPFWKTNSAIEFKSGFAAAKKLKVGDQLYVVN
jgi:uncharacterized membrane protein (UPF0127 family)